LKNSHKKQELMNPKVDFVFKSIFGNEKYPEILISFLNAVLNPPEEKKIIKVKIENPNIDKMDIEDKYSILDILATANDNTKIDIEIQIKNNYDMIPRTIYYLSKLIEGQMKEGEDYNRILKSITINIVDFELLKSNKRVHNSFLFIEKDTGEVLTDLAEIHFIELPKLKIEDINTEDLLNDWLLFIENPESEAIEMLKTKIKEIGSAKKVLEVLSLDKEARMVYESRQKALKDKISAINTAEKRGREEGIKEGKIEMAKEMLKDGENIDKIIKYTKLTKKEIEELK
jgi:predicted transposase/invertase (TIGR01784 family)